MPGHDVNVRVVADEEADRRNLRRAPKSCSAVCAAGDKVVTEWREADIPDWGAV